MMSAGTQLSLGIGRPRPVLAAGFAAAALLAGLLAGSLRAAEAPTSPAAAKPAELIVAKVGDRSITFAEVEVIAAQNNYDLRKPADVALAVRDAVNLEVLATEARKRGYDQDPEIQRMIRAQIVQRLLRDTVDAKGPNQLAPTDAEARAYYDAHLAEFTSPTVAQAQVVALLKRAGDDPAFAQKFLALKQGIEAKQPFGDLVKKFSDDPAAKTYGSVTNWLTRGEANKMYPDSLIEAVFSATDTNAVAGPIEHNGWVYFVKLREKREGRTTPFDMARPAIAQRLLRQKRVEAYNAFVTQLGQTVEVQSWPDKVSEQVKATTVQSGPPMGPVRSAAAPH